MKNPIAEIYGLVDKSFQTPIFIFHRLKMLIHRLLTKML